MPAGKRLAPRSTSARLAPSSTEIEPMERVRIAIHRFRSVSRLSAGTKRDPTSSPLTTRERSPGSLPDAITVGTPQSLANRAARTLAFIPPTPVSLWSSVMWSSISEPTSMVLITSAPSLASNSSRNRSTPATVLRITSKSAVIKLVTSAARWSLSPIFASSSASGSFSLTIGRMPRDRSSCNVCLALKNRRRSSMSSCIMRSCATTVARSSNTLANIVIS